MTRKESIVVPIEKSANRGRGLSIVRETNARYFFGDLELEVPRTYNGKVDRKVNIEM